MTRTSGTKSKESIPNKANLLWLKNQTSPPLLFHEDRYKGPVIFRVKKKKQSL